MAQFIFTDNANSTLAAPISPSAVSVTLASGTGALFPNPSAGQQFTLTFNDAATGLLYEVCYCTARTGDVCTIVRAQEGTVALSWAAGDTAFHGPTAGTLNAMQQSGALFPARVIITSGPFTINTTDAHGAIGLDRLIAPAPSSSTLPASAANGDTYGIEDLARNFNVYPVTISYPGGTTGPNGAPSQVLNVSGQCASFRFYAASNLWSFKP